MLAEWRKKKQKKNTKHMMLVSKKKIKNYVTGTKDETGWHVARRREFHKSVCFLSSKHFKKAHQLMNTILEE